MQYDVIVSRLCCASDSLWGRRSWESSLPFGIDAINGHSSRRFFLCGVSGSESSPCPMRVAHVPRVLTAGQAGQWHPAVVHASEGQLKEIVECDRQLKTSFPCRPTAMQIYIKGQMCPSHLAMLQLGKKRGISQFGNAFWSSLTPCSVTWVRLRSNH